MVKLWDVATGKELAAIRGSEAWVATAALAPDGKTLAYTTVEFEGRWVRGLLKLWDVPTGREFATLRGHEYAILCVAYSPDGTRLATGSVDQTVKLWAVPERPERKPEK
jgi:WD40 repeat protein